MNCQDFESNLDGLARGALIDARSRETALAHETGCVRCAARLADERAITSGLRALADETKDAGAPARVEAALLVALRAHAASNAVAEVAAVAKSGGVVASSESVDAKQFSENSNVRRLSENENVRRLSWTKTIAVAALAAAAALALFMLIPPDVGTPASKTKGDVAGNQAAGREQGTASSDVNETASTTSGGAVVEVSPSQTGSGVRSSTSTAVVDGSRDARVPVVRRPSNRTQAMNVNYGGGGSRSVDATVASATGNDEITTDFIPLMQGGRFTQAEGVHMVRVELPRSALARFGLPVNAEQGEGRVKADVLLGEDGVARAIRFVR